MICSTPLQAAILLSRPSRQPRSPAATAAGSLSPKGPSGWAVGIVLPVPLPGLGQLSSAGILRAHSAAQILPSNLIVEAGGH